MQGPTIEEVDPTTVTKKIQTWALIEALHLETPKNPLVQHTKIEESKNRD